MSTSKFVKVVDTNTDPHLTGGIDQYVSDNEDDETEDNETEQLEATEEDNELEDSDESSSEGDDSEDEDVLPRFKGKTKRDISDAYSNLEKDHGRLAQEVGELRKLAREWLQLESRNQDNQSKTVKITEDDLYKDPQEAISKVVQNELKPVRDQLEQSALKSRLQEFVSKHPDYKKLAGTSEFNDWVQASPYRQRLYQAADKLDFDAADELFTMYKDFSKLNTPSNNKEREKTLRKASSERGGTAGGKGKKKVWSSAYLVNLKITDPEKYNSLMPEIMEAYKEGRVK